MAAGSGHHTRGGKRELKASDLTTPSSQQIQEAQRFIKAITVKNEPESGFVCKITLEGNAAEGNELISFAKRLLKQDNIRNYAVKNNITDEDTPPSNVTIELSPRRALESTDHQALINFGATAISNLNMASGIGMMSLIALVSNGSVTQDELRPAVEILQKGMAAPRRRR